MKKITLLLLILSSICTFSQENPIKHKDITGFVIDEYGDKLPKVNIYIKEKNIGTTSDKNGYFKIKAEINDIIEFSYVGFKTLRILIEDATTILNIKLRSESNTLDEITIKTISSSNIIRKGRGFINVNSSSYIEGRKLNPASRSIARALQGKFPGLRVIYSIDGGQDAISLGRGRGGSAIWDIDGIVFDSIPPTINIESIKSVSILRSLFETNAYGSEGRGGVIVVETKFYDYQKSLRDVNSKDNPHTNKDYYNNDAISFNDLNYGRPKYYEEITNATSIESAFSIYNKISKKDFLLYINVADIFNKKFQNNIYTKKVLVELEGTTNNPEILKVIAYKYQEFSMHSKALSVYKEILEERPTHAQSYRDLANAYSDLNQAENSWEVYKQYFRNGFVIEENSIGEILNFEMKNLYINNKDKIKEKIDDESLNVDDTNDVRLVFEWNTSEAEFNIEFVNQNKQSNIITHNLQDNNAEIIDEKIKGYNSKQFVITPLKGKWIVNLKYFGNKKYTPTFMKTTIYYNWGRKNQTKKIKVFKLFLENVKGKLFELNAKELKLGKDFRP